MKRKTSSRPPRASSSAPSAGSSAPVESRSSAKRESKGKRPRPRGVFLLVLLALFGLSFLWFSGRPLSTSAERVELSFKGDEGVAEVLDKLAAKGFRGTTLSVYMRTVGIRPAPGPHYLRQNASPRELGELLSRRASKLKVTFPEGFTSFDMAKRVEQQGIASRQAFIDASRDKALLQELHIEGDSAEGYLFPATYEFPENADPKEIVRRLKVEFDKRFASLEELYPGGKGELSRTLGWTIKEIVILASMVEKEAVVDDERPQIASVFLNRLRDPDFNPKLLQCDPTGNYGCIRAKELGENLPAGCIHFKGKPLPEVNNDPTNEYSTYTHKGLPPSPISNPGMKSLGGVLSPTISRHLYFVARGGGRHAFSETYESHQNAVKGSPH
ncbi:MAG: endolytic transglycosylase MltG [Polyangiaceae bacterium]